MEHIEGIQYQVDQIADGDCKDKFALFGHVEVVMVALDKAKYKLKWTLPLHKQVKNLYVQNLILKRRLRLVKNRLTEVREAGRKRKIGKLEFLVEASTKMKL